MQNDQTKPLITVAGATSKQGRSAVLSLLRSGRYRVRALTRNTESPEARSLASAGAELYGISWTPGNLKDLTKAFQNSYGAFLMTPPIAPPDRSEFQIGKDLADAAVAAGVQHIIFSSLENVEKITGGKKWAPHFTDKAHVEEYIRTLPVRSSFIILAFFYTNFIEYYPPQKIGDTLVFPIYLPENFRAPYVDPQTAAGPAILEIFDHPDTYAGKSMPVVGDLITPHEMIDTFMRVTGKKAAYSSAFKREELIQHFPQFAKNEELVNEIIGMAEFAVEYGYFSKDRDLEWARRLNPQILTWEQFLRSDAKSAMILGT